MLTKENIWKKVKENEGSVFQTVTGKDFTYQVIDNFVITSRTKWHIREKDFQTAIELHPSKPSDITKDVYGPSYVFAIIKDLR